MRLNVEYKKVIVHNLPIDVVNDTKIECEAKCDMFLPELVKRAD